MIVFLDESFRTHQTKGTKFGALIGVAIHEDVFPQFQEDFYQICKPYVGTVLRDGHDVHGSQLLTNTTLKIKDSGNHCAHWSLAEDLLNFAPNWRVKMFGVVCFRTQFHSFICSDEARLDGTFRYLFERIDRYMRIDHPGTYAKLVFDDRGRQTNEKNARAITRFFLRSSIGSGYDTILKTPFYGLSNSHNYGLQLADLLTTVVARRFQGDQRINPLWRKAHRLLHAPIVAGQRVSSLKVMRA